MSEQQPPSWLDPLPIRWEAGTFHVRPSCSLTQAVPPIKRTFEQFVNSVYQPRTQIRRRTVEVRRALSTSLRYAHHPEYQKREPWYPENKRYIPFRSTIATLLVHPIWQHIVIAAPFMLYLHRQQVAGIVDAIIQYPDGAIGVVALHTTRREEHLVPAARAELGGLVASLADHQITWVSHAITLWAAPGITEAEFHHPDICIGLWSDAVDLARYYSKLKPKHLCDDPAAAHSTADSTRHQL